MAKFQGGVTVQPPHHHHSALCSHTQTFSNTRKGCTVMLKVEVKCTDVEDKREGFVLNGVPTAPQDPQG
ncbi:hypothetical protein E2C01_055009 [Portunus trituberculatus]|uniref:Uncharacterized protein n=1 Tax=Portunus trituberculatus TaxID=210409 RepID=A0A5B7GUS9_PORTR|nr:hypothetical protein [Portunus trituberculatus]